MAFEYLMAYYLLNRQLDRFAENLPRLRAVSDSWLTSAGHRERTFTRRIDQQFVQLAERAEAFWRRLEQVGDVKFAAGCKPIQFRIRAGTVDQCLGTFDAHHGRTKRGDRQREIAQAAE